MNSTRRCLLIGVNGYKPTIGQLRYCVSDVLQIEQALNTRRDGFASTQSTLLIDEQPDELRPTRVNIIENIIYLCNSSDTEDTLILYFSGHGILGNDGKCYLLPLDSSLASLEDTAISWQWICDKMDQCCAKNKILIIDACHSGAGKDPAASVRMSYRVFEQLSKNTEGYVCITSCSGGQLSYELPELGQGIFSHYLVDGILGAADPLGQGIINIESLFNYARERTLRHAKQLGVEQEPYLISKITDSLSTITISAASLERPINSVLVLTENPFLGHLLEIGIQTSAIVRRVKWANNIELAISDAKVRFEYDAVFVDVENNWKHKKEFILLIRHRYPIVPFVLVGSRHYYLKSLEEKDRNRFSAYFFFDVDTQISQVPIFISDTLSKVEWDIRTRHGARDCR